ncbi:MAG: thioredoxin domain-containing protein [Candidatus Kaiserbacteria bacterium]|nr:thioredoxin domain-containing protein [Candidatus Kaiserbacteria bacterium]
MKQAQNTNSRRIVVVGVAVAMVLGVLLYVEHPMVRIVKHIVAGIGAIDSQHTVVGMTDVRSVDHIRGNADADVVLIEYSDLGCIMCAAMQKNFEKIVQEEEVMLVSRHLYPHQKGSAFEAAVAAECVAKHTGEEAFFSFIQYVYENQGSVSDTKVLANKAAELGTDARQFQECIATDTKVRDRVKRDSDEGWRLGSRGTPYIVIVYKDRPIGISYANEYRKFLERVKMLVAKAKS